ncbi:MAG: hypothetical protein IT303_15165 [Dehalococcoidia bacterium]|nr:hypothetical protein [Dehalococcoidia bacterium]
MSRFWITIGVAAVVGLAVVAAAVAMRDGGDTPVSSTPGGNEPVPANAAPLHEARLDLAQRLGVPAKDAALLHARHAGFDGCLGVYHPDTACTEQFLGGYIAVYKAGSAEYRYHFGGGRFVAASFASSARIDDGMPVEAALRADFGALFAGYARHDAALRTGTPVEQLVVTAIVPVVFPDGCLGFYRPDVMCDMAISPGVIVLLAGPGGEEYRYHAGGASDQWTLVAVSFETGTVQTQPDAGLVARQLAVREDLAGRLGVHVGTVSVTQYREVTWPDGCLGIVEEGRVCTAALVDGWLMRVAAGGTEYRYHGGSGDAFRAASFVPGAELRDPLPREE